MNFLMEPLRLDVQRCSSDEACYDVTVFLGNKIWSYKMTGVMEATVILMCNVFLNFYSMSESLEDFIDRVENIDSIEDLLN